MPRSKRNARSSEARGDDGDVALYWRQPKAKVHQFTRLIAPNDIPKVAVDTSFGASFRLSDLPDYSEFTALFDQYRVDWVDYVFICKQNGASPAWPIIYFAEDHDDDTPPSLNEMWSKQDTQILQFGSNRTLLKLRVVPNTTRNVYQNGVLNGYERSPVGTWVDSATPSVPHYGIKYFVSNYNTVANPNATIQVIARYHISFKETK